MIDNRWEYGGDFPWLSSEQLRALAPAPQEQRPFANAQIWGTGRAALLALLAMGRAQRQWRRLWLPSYFCPHVTATLEGAGWPCPRYADSPLCAPAGMPENIKAGDVVLRVNFFGWRGAQEIQASTVLGCDVIEDHTQDPAGPWARGSRATYCVSSLRKVMPIPDGAILWSPAAAPLPDVPPPSALHLAAAGLKLGGMMLKQHYRAGDDVAKKAFYDPLVQGEAQLGIGPPTGIHPVSRAIIERTSLAALGRCRAANYRKILAHCPMLAPLVPQKELPEGASPFSIVLLFSSNAARERVRKKLIEERVYASVIWPLPEAREDGARDFGNRMFSLACHFHYRDDDFAALNAVLQKVEPLNKGL